MMDLMVREMMALSVRDPRAQVVLSGVVTPPRDVIEFVVGEELLAHFFLVDREAADD